MIHTLKVFDGDLYIPIYTGPDHLSKFRLLDPHKVIELVLHLAFDKVEPQFKCKEVVCVTSRVWGSDWDVGEQGLGEVCFGVMEGIEQVFGYVVHHRKFNAKI